MKVSIHLSDVNCVEPLPERIITLSQPSWSVIIGRGSQTDDSIEPGPTNAWFSSRVMSRKHAILRADPTTRLLTIEDHSSMHGTFVNGEKVGERPHGLCAEDILTLGTEVVRGEETYQPLKVLFYYDWEVDQDKQEVNVIASKIVTRNKFTVDINEDDFASDDDHDAEADDVEIIRETAREPSVEIVSRYDLKKSQAPKVTALSSHLHHIFGDMEEYRTCEERNTKNIDVSGIRYTSPPVEPVSDIEEEEDDYAVNSVQDHLDEDEGEASEVESDLFDDKSDISEEDTNEFSAEAVYHGLGQKSAQPQSIHNSKPECASSSEGIRREPSPSDAALARPRTSDLQMPPSSVKALNSDTSASSTTTPNPFGVFYKPDQIKYPLTNYPSFRVSNGFKPVQTTPNPYSYSPMGNSVGYGAPNSYQAVNPAYPWNCWRSTPTFTNPPQAQPSTQYGSFDYNVAHPLVPNGHATNSNENVQLTLGTSFNPFHGLSTGQKRKADDISNDQEEESVMASNDEISDIFDPRDDSPAPLTSSPVTAISKDSPEQVKMSEDEEPTTTEAERETESEARDLEDQPEENLEIVLSRSVTKNSNLDSMPTWVQTVTDEPPRKKIKTGKESGIAKRSRLSIALKYTATAVAGATVGALGTVIGLASLPPDFFA